MSLPHREDSSLTTYYPPKGEYIVFQDEHHYEEKVREWGLSTAKEIKKHFWYKGKTYQRLVTIVGYETFGVTDEFHTLVIQFQDGNLSCIQPAYLKEMQSATPKELPDEIAEPPVPTPPKSTKTLNEPKPKKSPKKEKEPKIELPVDKVHFTAKVKQFALMYNHFNEENDEVVVFEDVEILQDSPISIDYAWCSHSKTLKKQELAVGDTLEFDGKIVTKKLAKGKEVEDEELIVDVSVKYKLNNPSKIKKV